MGTDAKLPKNFDESVTTDKRDYRISRFFSPRNFSLGYCLALANTSRVVWHTPFCLQHNNVVGGHLQVFAGFIIQAIGY